jgi:hypothetical protein
MGGAQPGKIFEGSFPFRSLREWAAVFLNGISHSNAVPISYLLIKCTCRATIGSVSPVLNLHPPHPELRSLITPRPIPIPQHLQIAFNITVAPSHFHYFVISLLRCSISAHKRAHSWQKHRG